MALDDLAFAPHDPDDLRAFSFSNQAAHRDINRVIFQTLNIIVPEYILDPLDPNNMGNWAWQHQQMHNQAWAAIGGSGYDLTGINWKDARYMEMWTNAHSDEHSRLAAILGL